MRGNATIVINGRHYDAATGLPVEHTTAQIPQKHVGNDFASLEKPAKKFAQPEAAPTKLEMPKSQRTHANAHEVHGSTQRSQTLLRSAVKKPEASHPVERHREHSKVPRSPHITKFAAHPQPLQKKVEKPDDSHVAVAFTPRHKVAHHHHSSTMPTKQISSRAIKEHLINEQLTQAEPAHYEQEYKEGKSRGRVASLATAGLALVILGAYLSYLNMPNLSIRIAAAQAGIDATLPEYHPDGYRFNNPVAYTQGEVDMTYSATAGPQSYSISQKASDWDSQAVLDNYVMKESNGRYEIHSTQGLTVYTFGNKATWVNNGILHTVDFSNAPLSYNQIERIAASM